LPLQRPLSDRKSNFRSFIYSHSFTNPANLVKIYPADVENIWSDRNRKNIYKIKQQLEAGWAQQKDIYFTRIKAYGMNSNKKLQ